MAWNFPTGEVERRDLPGPDWGEMEADRDVSKSRENRTKFNMVTLTLIKHQNCTRCQSPKKFCILVSYLYSIWHLSNAHTEESNLYNLSGLRSDAKRPSKRNERHSSSTAKIISKHSNICHPFHNRTL